MERSLALEPIFASRSKIFTTTAQRDLGKQRLCSNYTIPASLPQGEEYLGDAEEAGSARRSQLDPVAQLVKRVEEDGATAALPIMNWLRSKTDRWSPRQQKTSAPLAHCRCS